MQHSYRHRNLSERLNHLFAHFPFRESVINILEFLAPMSILMYLIYKENAYPFI